MNIADLLKDMPNIPPSLSTGNSVPTGKPETMLVPDPPILTEHCTFTNLGTEHWYPEGIEHAKHHGFTLANHFQEALQKRSKGEKCITLREADIAARGKINLHSALVLAGIMDGLNFLVEGVVGTPENPYELRARYNRGIQYKKEKFEQDTPAKQQAAIKIMKYLMLELNRASLPLWEREVTKGFCDSLLFPEFMTHDQYMQARLRTRRLYQTSGEVLDTEEQEQVE